MLYSLGLQGLVLYKHVTELVEPIREVERQETRDVGSAMFVLLSAKDTSVRIH